MNPFNEKALPLDKLLENWPSMYPEPYDKRNVDPYTKTRIILMNGTEYEANWFSHAFLRHTDNYELRQKISLTRFLEKQQQQKISLLKPLDESVLEQTIAYEQLAVDLTAELAKRESDFYVKQALDFALLEDFDHLFRFSNLLETDDGIAAETLVGRYTEIMPSRPTLAHHRYPTDNPKRNICEKRSTAQTILNTMIITAAEQQTMNYYMNQSAFYHNDAGRKLFEEICLVEEEHVTQYGSLMYPNGTWLEGLLWHEYVECYLYYSCMATETDPRIKAIWAANLEAEISHLHNAAALLRQYEGKEWQQVIENGEFPAPISLHENIDYVRGIIKNTAQYTMSADTYLPLADLDKNHNFFRYQQTVNSPLKEVPSHNIIDAHIKKFDSDYRFVTAKLPLDAFADRKADNTSVGVDPQAAGHGSFESL